MWIEFVGMLGPDYADGEKLAEYPLDSHPAFDGLIAAAGKLLCFAKPQPTSDGILDRSR